MIHKLQRIHWIFLVPILLIVLSLACNVPSINLGGDDPAGTSDGTTPGQGQTETLEPTPLPSPTSQSLPPAVISMDPIPGGALAQGEPVTIVFNQPMDPESVAGALSVANASNRRVEWEDERTMLVYADQQAEQALTLSLSSDAQAVNGLSMRSAVDISYLAPTPLELTNALPEDGTRNSDPTAGIIASFNQPVVPLGADPADGPAAFTISPAAEGQGEWISTSTYVFYPDPPLNGGQNYTVEVNPALTSVTGGALEAGHSWEFTTTAPVLNAINIYEDTQVVPLDSVVKLDFNQPMNSSSAAANFSLMGPNGNTVSGDTQWNEDFTTMVFTPTNLLSRDRDYTVTVLGSMRSLGGTALEEDSSLTFHTVPNLRITNISPVNGATTLPGYNQIVLYFNGPIEMENVLDYISIQPEIDNPYTWWQADQGFALQINGQFDPNTEYTVEVSPNLPDPYGGKLDTGYSTRFTTGDRPPSLGLFSGISNIFVQPAEPVIPAQVTNLTGVSLSLGRLPFNDFTQLVSGEKYLFEFPAPALETWVQPIETTWNQNETVDLSLSPNGGSIAPGIYYFSVHSEQIEYNPSPSIVIASDYNVSLKVSGTQVFVWVVDLRTNEPAANKMVSILQADGVPVNSGYTDEDGVFSAPYQPGENIYSPVFAIIGQPGEDNFAVGTTNWNLGIAPYDFDIPTTTGEPSLTSYIYTDRPIYRPGDTVYYRVISREAENGRYSLPLQPGQVITLFSPSGDSQEVTKDYSSFGTIHGEFQLPENSAPGYYLIQAGERSEMFQVAEYRKPEIDLQVSLSPGQAITGTMLTGEVNARYFFDAPVGDVPLRWTLYANPSYFNIPDYQAGEQVLYWLLPPWMRYSSIYGYTVSNGQGRTDADGIYSLEIPVDEYRNAACGLPCRYTLEVTVIDESEFPVSARSDAVMHAADFYIGVRPDYWVGRADDVIGFDIKLVDLDGDPIGSKALRAEFQEVEFVRTEPETEFDYPSYVPEYTMVSSSDFQAGADGLARLEFTPPDSGMYILSVSGDGAATDVLLWVAGEGQPVWPSLANQQLELTPDKDSYLPGETATVFIPNPFEDDALALLTIERGEVMRHQVVSIVSSGLAYEIPLTSDDAPNVFLAVTLLGVDDEGRPDFRQGYVNIPVEPVDFELNVEVISDPQRAGPRDEVTFTIQVADQNGSPVEGEFSLAVVDKAIFALADFTVPEITDFFYGTQFLAVRSSMNLAIYAQREVLIPGGKGGGGGDGAGFFIREDFPDTALWQADIVTDANGVAEVSLQLPDNLTTWNISVRGLTSDTRVGQTETEIVTTKPMLVRPVTPRFFTAGDHLALAAIVQNNTDEALEVEVALQATGFQLDDPGFNRQTVEIPAGGRQRVEWWGTVSLIDQVDLVFLAEASNGLQDASRPEWGTLPVMRYDAPQTFATSGVLQDEGEQLELVSVPPTVEDLTSGNLEVTLSTSLAGSLITALDVLESQPYGCTEQLLSGFLPNLEMYRTLQELGIEAPELQARLDRSLAESLDELISRQNIDGGWSWWGEGESNPYISTYVVYGLARAAKAGVSIDPDVMQAGVSYVLANLSAPEMLSDTWQLDRLAFSYYTLMEAGETSSAGVESMFYLREELSPWAQALLLLTIDDLSLGEDWEQTLRSNLLASAQVTGSGTFWDDSQNAEINLSTPVFNTAVVAYAIARTAPDSTLLPDAARYLMAHRENNGGWYSTYESSWSILALSEFMKVSGELQGDYDFSAYLNTTQIVEDQASSQSNLTPVTSSVPVSSLYPDLPNALMIEHGPGEGPLYYTAHLNVMQPVEAIQPYQRGIVIERSYHPAGDGCTEESCPAIAAGDANDLVQVHLAVTVENDAYYLMVEDFIPAGAEVLNTSLKTSELGAVPITYQNPLVDGWGWWYFNDPQVYDERVVWAVDYLPAGAYHLTYTLVLTTPGEYHVIPASARQFYFPEVQGNSAGDRFVIGE